MIIAPEDIAFKVKNAISNVGVKINEIGFVDESGVSKLIKETGEEELKPLLEKLPTPR